tara:strand:- start:1104 stop:1337 length:234 start_codon:yes stop_codon:yes gene_type:complete
MMGGILSPMKPPAPPPPPAPMPAPVVPTRSDADIRAARENERKRRLAAAGRQSTILTSGQGVTEEATATKSTLLGGY